MDTVEFRENHESYKKKTSITIGEPGKFPKTFDLLSYFVRRVFLKLLCYTFVRP